MQQTHSTSGSSVNTAPASSTILPKLLPFTFSATTARMLKPFSKNAKKLGKLKVAPRVIGKLVELSSGTRVLVVELKGKDIFRGRHKSLHAASEVEEVGIPIDRILLNRAPKYGVTHVMAVVEETGRIFLAPLERFLDPDLSFGRTNWQGRATRVVGTHNLLTHHTNPTLKGSKKRANA